ncbi:MAG TPA: hypothetical protein VFY29_08260 [Terriglobia bacterium]|nr:hypothetical protein [Terriglobia bacterium]
MPKKRKWTVLIAVVFIAVALAYATHTYEERQAYKAGAYIGRAAFTTADYQDRHCLSRHADCEVHDLNDDRTMEDAMASANIIPALADSTALHSGFRDGWREARTAAFSNRPEPLQ